ncbi:MAG TPA: hypothetical protein VF469_03225 [Kofleriaceae bacterium]
MSGALHDQAARAFAIGFTARSAITSLCMLRADFHGAFMESPQWHGRLSYLGVGPLRDEALCQAIVNPARDVGVRLEPEFVTQLLTDASSEPGCCYRRVSPGAWRGPRQ